MPYPVVIESGGSGSAYGVVVPDLPGYFSAGATLEDALAAAREAVAFWIDATRDAGGVIPAPLSVGAWRSRLDGVEWIVGTIEVVNVGT